MPDESDGITPGSDFQERVLIRQVNEALSDGE